VVGPGGQEKDEPIRHGRRVRDHRLEPARAEEMPEGDLAPHAVAVRVDVRRQGDAAAGGQHRCDALSGDDTLGSNGNAILHTTRYVGKRRCKKTSRKNVTGQREGRYKKTSRRDVTRTRSTVLRDVST